MGARILVADDSATIQKVVELTFSKEDFQLVAARTGEEAIQKAREVRPDLMLIDLVMPDKSGYEVCETLRKDPLLKDVPIILLTGTFDTFDKSEGARVGVTDFVTKPFESQSLIGKVKQLLFARSIAAPPQPAAPLPPAAPPVPAPLAAAPPLELVRTGPEVPPPLSPAASKSAGSGGTELSEASLWDLLERERPAAEPIHVLPEQTGPGLKLGPPVDEREPTVPATPGGDTDPTAGLTDLATGLSIPVELLPAETEATAARPGGAAPAQEVTMPLLESVEILPEETPASPASRASAPPAAAWPAAGAAVPVDVDRLTREITDRVARTLVQEVSDRLAGKIERIVWEVVPDLAEHLITQEIERIKGQAEGPREKA